MNREVTKPKRESNETSFWNEKRRVKYVQGGETGMPISVMLAKRAPALAIS